MQGSLGGTQGLWTNNEVFSYFLYNLNINYKTLEDDRQTNKNKYNAKSGFFCGFG